MKENTTTAINVQPLVQRESLSFDLKSREISARRATGIRGGSAPSLLHLFFGCLSGVCIWIFMEECC